LALIGTALGMPLPVAVERTAVVTLLNNSCILSVMIAICLTSVFFKVIDPVLAPVLRVPHGLKSLL
jgi:hypothetical protein